ncbi:unnamed protein product [Brachionus calyciflorus]|uniref:Uncharacterized protein n=1 Tax=Brachionus calyciflorus TaxID=104777 RepID=A0A813MJ02_9BILA|nr:unnamed protein product [Brachionus calyciflorus]
MNIQEFFESKFEKHEIPKSDENWLVGSIEEFDFTSINNFGRVVIHNGKVYITYSISILDAYLGAILSDSIKTSLNFNSNKQFLIGIESKVNVCNTFGGGYVHTKIPDSKIFSHRDTDSRPIAIKCSFSNENLSLLLEECVVYLNEFTRFSYSIGFKVNYDPQKFKAYLFVFERMVDPDEKRIKLMNFSIHKNMFRIYGNYPQVELDKFQEAFNQNDMSEFNVKICFKKEIDENNVSEKVEFLLDRSRIDPDVKGDVKVEISTHDLIHIFNLWKKKFIKIEE